MTVRMMLVGVEIIRMMMMMEVVLVDNCSSGIGLFKICSHTASK